MEKNIFAKSIAAKAFIDNNNFKIPITNHIIEL